MEEFGSLSQFLTWVIGGGAVIIVSWAFERLDWFQSLTPKMREFLMFLVPSILAIGAFAVQQFVPAELIVQASPYFMILVGIFGYVFLGKGFHLVDKNTSAKE